MSSFRVPLARARVVVAPPALTYPRPPTRMTGGTPACIPGRGQAAATSAKVLSGGYIASNLVSVLSKQSGGIESELKLAMDLDLDGELKALAQVGALVQASLCRGGHSFSGSSLCLSVSLSVSVLFLVARLATPPTSGHWRSVAAGPLS